MNLLEIRIFSCFASVAAAVDDFIVGHSKLFLDNFSRYNLNAITL